MTPNCKAIRKMDLMTACQLYFGQYFILKIVKVKYYVYRVSLKIFKGLDLAEPDKNTTKFEFCFFFQCNNEVFLSFSILVVRFLLIKPKKLETNEVFV